MDLDDFETLNERENTINEDDDSANIKFEPYTATVNLYCPHPDCEDNEVFLDNESFKNHMLFDHGNDRPFKCYIGDCTLSYRKKGALDKHIERVHRKKRNFKCDVCGSEYYDKNNFKEHCRIHRGEKGYECRQCNRSFKQRQGLTNHIRFVHKNIRNYQCSVCNKKFHQKDGLEAHYRIHTGEKPFGCNRCNKRFRTKGELNFHLRGHSGEKPYECTKCHKRFRQSRDRKEHQKRCSSTLFVID